MSHFCIACAITLTVSTAWAQDATSESPANLVRRYLAVRFDEFEKLPDGSQLIYGPAFDADAELKPLLIPELKTFLPATQFFRTSLDTPYISYPRLETIVALTKIDNRFEIRSSVSPVFAEPSKKLLAIVRGKTAVTDDAKKLLVTGVGKMLASITHAAALRNPTVSGQTASVQLWHGDLHWLDIVLLFDKSQSVEATLVSSAHDPKQ